MEDTADRARTFENFGLNFEVTDLGFLGSMGFWVEGFGCLVVLGLGFFGFGV